MIEGEQLNLEVKDSRMEEDRAHGTHTVDFEGKMYDVYAVIDANKETPVEVVPTETFAHMIEAGMEHWDDTDAKPLGANAMLQDWEAAKANPLWAEHVAKIEKADLAHPILVHRPTKTVFDGMHRLAKAVRDHVSQISVKYFDTLPDSAIVADHPHRHSAEE